MDKNKRRYNQFCGLAKTLDIVGERWTLLIVRNLLLGPLRYSELLRGLPGITTNLLANRLAELTEAGLTERIRVAAGDLRGAYRLTERGAALEPAIHALGSWGWDYMRRGPGDSDNTRFEWYLVAMKRRYKGGLRLTAELIVDDVPYTLRLDSRSMVTYRGSASDPALVIRGNGTDVIQWLRGGPRQGIEMSGEPGAGQRLRKSFRLGDSS